MGNTQQVIEVEPIPTKTVKEEIKITPLRTNVTIFANGDEIDYDNTVIMGNNNTIRGNNNIVMGNNNTVIGDNNQIMGIGNTFKGIDNFITKESNQTVIVNGGSTSIIQGPYTQTIIQRGKSGNAANQFNAQNIQTNTQRSNKGGKTFNQFNF